MTNIHPFIKHSHLALLWPRTHTLPGTCGQLILPHKNLQVLSFPGPPTSTPAHLYPEFSVAAPSRHATVLERAQPGVQQHLASGRKVPGIQQQETWIWTQEPGVKLCFCQKKDFKSFIQVKSESILQTKRKFIPNTQKLYDGGKGKIGPYLGKSLWLSQYSIKYFFWNQLFAWSLGHCLYNQKNRPPGRKMCGYVRLRTQLPEIAREGNIIIQSECLCSSWLIIVTSTASTKVLKIMTVPPLSPSFLFLPWGFRCPKSTINNSFCWNLALWGRASRNRRHRSGSFFLLELLL